MLVREIMSNKPLYLPITATLQEAAKKMKDFDVGIIPISNENDDKLVGIITDRDITIRAVAKGLNPHTTAVKEILSKKVLYIYEDESIEIAAMNMEQLQVHRLIVLNRDKRLTGIISIGDLARKTHDEELCGKVIEFISKRREAA